MGKFSFTGRKKQPPQVTVTAPPMSKAQKILGSNVINIDDESSSSKTSLTVNDRPGIPTRSPSLRASPRAAPEWEEESDIIPRHIRNNEGGNYDGFDEYDDMTADMTSVMRKRRSAASLNEWYDKSKQPLAISQQTSSSAIAKGLPSKAHRMLDMDHTQSNVKTKNKPSRLDLTQIMTRKSKKNERGPWEGPVLGAEHLTRSPSILSPSGSPGLRGKLKKRPTKESLQSVQSGPRSGGSDASRRGNHLDGLPNLYEHYEQMSFRQIMEEELNAMEDEEVNEPLLEEVQEDVLEQVLEDLAEDDMEPVDEEEEEHYEEEERQTYLEPLPQKMYNVPVSKSAQNLPLPHHAEHIVSQYARRTLPQTPQAALLTKTDMSSPTDCAASVSSRHTRTSKASKRTDQSLHESDLQEKSMLMLSSDSEDEAEVYDPSFRGPASVPEYPISDSSSVYSSQRPTSARTSQSADNKRASRVTNNSQNGKFLAIPTGHPNAAAVTRFSSQSGSSNNTIQEANSNTLARSPSAASCMSNSSINTTMTWQSKIGLGLHQARAVTVQSARGPDEDDLESRYSDEQDQDMIYRHEHQPEPEHEADDELETSHIQASTIRDSIISGGEQPTPPLSPSSVDFYIDGAAAHGRFMAVTRQEEMLLSALRHKRQIMRETILNEMEDNARAAEGRSVQRGHMSKPSEATIAESHFELDFPAPPMCKNKTTVTADGTTIIDLRHGSSASQFFNPPEDEDIPDVPALPPNHQALAKGQKEVRGNQHERILLYLDHPLHDHDGPIEEAEPSPDLSDFMEFDAEESESGDGLSEVVLYPTQMRRGDNSRSSSKHRSGMVKPLQLKPNNGERVIEYDIPRPDSPISPDPMTATKPRRGTINSRTARLSAVGPARWGYED